MRRALWLAAVGSLFALAALAGWEYARLPTVADMSRLASERPGETSVMRARAAGRRKGPGRRQIWAELGQIHPLLVSAVLASEDAAFWSHDGVDPHEVGEAVKEAAEGHRLRGASTITQQVAKNLWLGEKRSVVRKLEEALLARRLEEALSKKRILTLYLNIAEWGDRAWGAEAAAQEHFGHSAAQLQPWEAAALAAMLPSPRRLAPARKNPTLAPRVERVLRFLVDRHQISEEQARAALQEVRRRVGPQAAQAEGG